MSPPETPWDAEKEGRAHQPAGSRARHIRRRGERVTLVNTDTVITDDDWNSTDEEETEITTWAVLTQGGGTGAGVERVSEETGDEIRTDYVAHFHERYLGSFALTDGEGEGEPTRLTRAGGEELRLVALDPQGDGTITAIFERR